MELSFPLHMDFALLKSFVFNWFAFLWSDMIHDIHILQQTLITSGAFPILCFIFLSMMMSGHLMNWNVPRQQMRIQGIIIMPSIISFASLAALRANEDSMTLFIVLDTIKECSVGLGIALFLSLMHTYLNLNSKKLTVRGLRAKIGARVIHNVFPVTLVQPRYILLNQNNLKYHRCWTWQFVVIRLVCSVFMIVLHLLDMYPAWLNWLFFFIVNVSVALAFFTVFAFYQAFVEDFDLHTPFTKFLYVKGIVLVCFLQGGVLKVLVAMGIIKSNHFWRQELHNNLVILEMLGFTILQSVAYGFEPYVDIPCFQDRHREFPVSKLAPPNLAPILPAKPARSPVFDEPLK